MRDMRSFFGRGIEDTIFLALFASHYDQLLFSRSLRACSTELLPLVRSSRQRALALSNGCRQPLVHRASMLLATSSQTPAESRSSCLVKLSTRGCLRSFVTSTRTSCCGIDLDQMSARYLSVYFHNVTGESGRVFMRRSKPSIRSPRRRRQGGSGRTRRGRAARL
jgi:hypothetical protein